MENEELYFTFVKLNDEGSFRVVLQKDGIVIDIVESNLRNCVNQQLEMLQKHGFTEEKWRVRAK